MVYSFLVLAVGAAAVFKAPCYTWNCVYYTEVGQTLHDILMFAPFKFYER